MDPSLHNLRKHETLTVDMASRGMVECMAPVEEGCGPFSVRKKNDGQRLIVDALRSNAHFALPGKVRLAAAERFGEPRAGTDSAIEQGGDRHSGRTLPTRDAGAEKGNSVYLERKPAASASSPSPMVRVSAAAHGCCLD